MCLCLCTQIQAPADRGCLENSRGGQQGSDSNHIRQPDMSQANGNLQIAIREAAGDLGTMNRQTDGRGVTVVLFSSPVWCTATCHWSAVCACPSKEWSSSWLLPLSLYMEAIKVLLSEKWTDKERSVSVRREKRERTSAQICDLLTRSTRPWKTLSAQMTFQ